MEERKLGLLETRGMNFGLVALVFTSQFFFKKGKSYETLESVMDPFAVYG